MNCYELTNPKMKGVSRDQNASLVSHCRELERWPASCLCHSAVNGQMAYDNVTRGKLETQVTARETPEKPWWPVSMALNLGRMVTLTAK